MNITGAQYKDGVLTLQCTGTDAVRFAAGFKPGDYELTKEKKRRSNDANSYLWELCGQISQAMAVDNETVYCDAIRHVGAYDSLAIHGNSAYEDFCRVWSDRGIAWFVEQTDEDDNGWHYCKAYYGSSSYDTRQMSSVIDYMVDVAQSIGIETDSGRITSLLEAWDAKQ